MTPQEFMAYRQSHLDLIEIARKEVESQSEFKVGDRIAIRCINPDADNSCWSDAYKVISKWKQSYGVRGKKDEIPIFVVMEVTFDPADMEEVPSFVYTVAPVTRSGKPTSQTGYWSYITRPVERDETWDVYFPILEKNITEAERAEYRAAYKEFTNRK